MHVLHQPNESEEWNAELRLSLDRLPVNVYNLEGTHNNILDGRIRGFNTGSSPYISFADPDDIVHIRGIEECLNVLENDQNISGVYTNSTVLMESGREFLLYKHKEWTVEWHAKTALPIHQLCVIRREVMEQALRQLPKDNDIIKAAYMFPEQLIFAHVAKIAPWKFLPDIIGYVWRKRASGAHKHGTRNEKQIIRNYIKSLLKNT